MCTFVGAKRLPAIKEMGFVANNLAMFRMKGQNKLGVYYYNIMVEEGGV